MQKLEDIKILRVAEDLCVGVYKISEKFPGSELFGLTSQVRRAASSVCANIAEGFYRSSDKDFANFLAVARGSVGETIVLLGLGQKLGYLDSEGVKGLRLNYEDLIRSINALIKHLKNEKS